MADCIDNDEFVIPPAELPDLPTGYDASLITDGCVNGNGIYDVFMKAHMDAIHQEYIKGRITGPEYSQVYLGGMQAAMQQAVVFGLSKDKAAAEGELSRYAILKASYENELVKEQICLIRSQVKESESKVRLTEAQTWVELAKISTNINSAYVMLFDDLDTAPLNTTGVFGAQVSKTNADTALVGQKTVSELAQTNEAAADPKSLLGRQRLVHKRQADGFLRSAEVAMAKLYGDIYAVQVSALDGVGDDQEFSAANIASAMGHAKSGVEEQDEDAVDGIGESSK